MMLSDDDLQAAEHRARRFQGAYTGTGGTLAADSIRQIKMIRQLQKELNMLEAAHAATDAPSDSEYDRQQFPSDWILRGERELKAQREQSPHRPLGAGVIADGGPDETPDDDVSPSERLLLNAAAAVRDRRRRYGPPRDHFTITVNLINAAFGTAFRPEDWATIMQLDKIARSRGPADHPDNDVDGAGYAACRAECRAP